MDGTEATNFGLAGSNPAEGATYPALFEAAAPGMLHGWMKLKRDPGELFANAERLMIQHAAACIGKDAVRQITLARGNLGESEYYVAWAQGAVESKDAYRTTTV